MLVDVYFRLPSGRKKSIKGHLGRSDTSYGAIQDAKEATEGIFVSVAGCVEEGKTDGT